MSTWLQVIGFLIWFPALFMIITINADADNWVKNDLIVALAIGATIYGIGYWMDKRQRERERDRERIAKASKRS